MENIIKYENSVFCMMDVGRYLRQKNLVSQDKLGDASVLIVGVGGLGSFSAIYLTMAGIGKIVLVDYDVVEESNLNRQVLYREEDMGKKKVYIAAKRLKEINPQVELIPLDGKIGEVEIPEVDIVVDGLDNLEARFTTENFALKRGIPYVFGAVEGYMGMVTFIDEDTKKLEDFLPRIEKALPQVLVSTVGMIAAIQSAEVIKYLNSKGDLLKNRLLIYDALSTNFVEVKL